MKKGITIILLIICNSMFAQKLGLQGLMDSLKVRNSDLALVNAAIKTTQIERKNRSYFGATSTSFQQGQINTVLSDRYIDVDQEIMNPLSVSGLRKMDTYAIQSRTLGAKNKFESLRLELLNLYVEALYFEAILDLYNTENNLFESYLSKAQYMFELNEISSADYALIKVQLSQIQLKVAQSEQILHEIDERLHNLSSQPNEREILFSESDWGNLVDQLTDVILSSRFMEEKEINGMYTEQQQKIAKMSYLPNLSLGYFNQTIENQRGFQGLKVGLTFNLLDGTNNQALKTAQIQEQLNEEQMAIQRIQLENRLQNVRHHLDLYNALYLDLDSTSLQVKKDLNNYANTTKEAGEINPLEYIQVRQKAMEMELARMEALLNIRKLKNELFYLTTN